MFYFIFSKTEVFSSVSELWVNFFYIASLMGRRVSFCLNFTATQGGADCVGSSGPSKGDIVDNESCCLSEKPFCFPFVDFVL